MKKNHSLQIITSDDEESKHIQTKYMGFLASYSKNSRIAAHGVVNTFTKFLNMNGLSMHDISQDHINMFVETLNKKEISAQTFNQRISLLNSFLKKFGKTFFLKRRPVTKYANINLITEYTLVEILKNIRHKMSLKDKKHNMYFRDYILFQFSYITGLRKSEVLSARHCNFKLNGDTWQYRSKGKGGTDITKAIPDYLYGIVDELKIMENKTDDDYVFTSPNKGNNVPIKGRTYNYIVLRYCDKSTPTVHSIRNLSAFKVYESTRCILETKAHLGHSSLNTTQIYLEKGNKIKPTYHQSLVNTVTCL
jgi:integrase